LRNFIPVYFLGSSIVVLSEELAKYVIFAGKVCERTPSGLLPVGVAFSLLEGPISLIYLHGAEDLGVLWIAGAATLAFVVPLFLHWFLATPYLIRLPIGICFGLSLGLHYLWNWAVRSFFQFFA
jgi:hypothetical protein